MTLSMRIRLAALLMFVLAAAPAAVSAQTTADWVKDKESLKAFVIDAKRHIESLTDYNDVIALRETVRERADLGLPARPTSMFVMSDADRFHRAPCRATGHSRGQEHPGHARRPGRQAVVKRNDGG